MRRLNISELVRQVGGVPQEARTAEAGPILPGSTAREERQKTVISDAVNPASMAEVSMAGGAARRTVAVEGHVLAEEKSEGATVSGLTQPRNSADRTRQIIEEVRGNLLLLAPLAPRQEALVKQSLKLLRLVLGSAPGSADPAVVSRAGSADRS